MNVLRLWEKYLKCYDLFNSHTLGIKDSTIRTEDIQHAVNHHLAVALVSIRHYFLNSFSHLKVCNQVHLITSRT